MRRFSIKSAAAPMTQRSRGRGLDEEDTMTTAVIGATGHVGSEIVRGMLERGDTVAALVRDPDEARHIFGEPDGLHIRPTRLDDPDDLTEALDGTRTLFIAMGSIGIEGVLQRIALHRGLHNPRVRDGYISPPRCRGPGASRSFELPPLDRSGRLWSYGTVVDSTSSSGVPLGAHGFQGSSSSPGKTGLLVQSKWTLSTRRATTRRSVATTAT